MRPDLETGFRPFAAEKTSAFQLETMVIIALLPPDYNVFLPLTADFTRFSFKLKAFFSCRPIFNTHLTAAKGRKPVSGPDPAGTVIP